MSRSPEERRNLARLTDAVAAYLEHQERGGGEAEFLDAHPDLRDLLEPMIAEPGADPDEDSRAFGEERYVGDYRLIREVGRGGMGVVYEANHVPLGRRVALKVLPAHVTLEPRQIERFRREAAAAAKLRHRAIVPIYDVGEADGTYYFSMEFIEGRNLAQILADKPEQKLRIDGVSGGYVAQVAEVIARVADALHYAHDNGVLHRDVKPHNVLIGDDGSVRLVDFGLARDENLHSLTASEGFAGTPYYASPEQVGGRRHLVDARSDVFSLGVVLYELLARERPFDAETSQDLMHAIRASDPKPLRRVNHRVPNDLCVICHKALEKDPANRFATAGELAADLRRFLRLEPIVAQPPGPLTRFGKAVRRNRRRVTVAALALLVVVGGPTMLWRSEAALREQEREHLRHAKSLLAEALDALSISEYRPGSESEYIHRLENLAKRYDEVAQMQGADPEFRYKGVRVIAQLGTAYGGVGDYAGAVRRYTEAIRRLGEITAQHPEVAKFRLAYASMHHDRSLRYRDTADWEASWQDLERALEIYNEVDGRPLGAEDRRLVTIALAGAHATRGKLLVVQQGRDLGKARLEYEASLRTWSRIDTELRSNQELALKRALIRMAYGALLLRMGSNDTATTSLEAARTELEALHQKQPHNPAVRYGIASIHLHLAELDRQAGDQDAAFEHLRSSARIHARLIEDFPRTLSHGQNLAAAELRLAELLWGTGEARHREEAWTVGCRAQEGARRLFDQAPDVFAHLRLYARLTLLRALMEAGRGGDGKQLAAGFRRAAELFRQMIERNPRSEVGHCKLSESLSHQAHWESQGGELEQAQVNLEEALRVEKIAFELNPGRADHALSLRKIKKSLEQVEAERVKRER